MTGNDATYAYHGLERLFHERARLSICTCLIAHERGLSFTELLASCDLTDGNLNRHLAALAEDGIVGAQRRRAGRRPTTTYRITKRGRERFLAYIDALEAVVRDVHARRDASLSDAKLAPT